SCTAARWRWCIARRRFAVGAAVAPGHGRASAVARQPSGRDQRQSTPRTAAYPRGPRRIAAFLGSAPVRDLQAHAGCRARPDMRVRRRENPPGVAATTEPYDAQTSESAAADRRTYTQDGKG